MDVRRTVVPTLVSLALLAPASAGAANDLANGSFERGLRAWTPAGAKLSIRAGGVHGSQYARATRRSGSVFGLRTAPSISPKLGQIISASVSVRAPRGKRVCVRVRESARGKLLAQTERCIVATGTWKRPRAVVHVARRAGSRIVLAVVEKRTATRNRLDADRAVLVAKPLGAGPANTPTPGTIITTTQPWNCTGALSAFGKLPIKVVSTIANASSSDNDNAVNLRGCRGDGDDATIDLILDVRGDGKEVGTSYDAVRIGQNARDLQVTGNAECGARSTNPSIHQDIVQALSGSNITFVDFTSGNPQTGRWTCWGAGGGWYVTWANAGIPTDLVCLRCKLATYNQNLRIDESVRSGARDSVFGYSRSYGIFIGPEAVDPINVNNKVIRY